MTLKKIELFQYQKDDIIQMENLDGRVLNANEMGLGKTIETLYTLKRNPDWLPALIVCPASVKYNWQREAMSIGFNPSVCEGQKPPVFNRSDFNIHPSMMILNYDILHHWLPYLKKVGIRTIVCDESHFLTNPDTQRTKAVRKICKSVPHVMMLSGTPLTNRLSELWPQLNMLWPEQFPSFTEYAHTYCNPKRTRWGWDYSRSSNVEQLHGQLKQLGMIRRRKVDVLKDLPEKIRYVVPMDYDQKEYKHAAEDFLGWLKKTNPTRVNAAEKSEALTKIGYLLRLSAKLKLRSVVEWVNKFLAETDQKLVLFAHHRQVVDVFKRRIEAKKVVIDGDVTGRMRQIAVDQFQEDPDTRLCIGSSAARIGVTLTAASTVAFSEFWWRPADHTQGEDRVYRIGQKNVSSIYYLIAAMTLEEKLCKILQDKQKTISNVLDGGDTPEDLNVLELLLRELTISLKGLK